MGSNGHRSHAGLRGWWQDWHLRRACRQTGPLLRPFVEGELAPHEADRVRRHLSRCPECAESAASLSAAIATTRGLAVPEMPADFSERLRARLALEPAPRPTVWQRAVRRAPGGGRAFPLGLSAAAAH
jgi:anti-sigma factor RsiW